MVTTQRRSSKTWNVELPSELRRWLIGLQEKIMMCSGHFLQQITAVPVRNGCCCLYAWHYWILQKASLLTDLMVFSVLNIIVHVCLSLLQKYEYCMLADIVLILQGTLDRLKP